MSREAMKLALEALIVALPDLKGYWEIKAQDAITILKQALEQPEPEPVAVVSGYFGGKCVVLPTDPARIFNSGTAFYTHPPKRKPLTDEEIADLWSAQIFHIVDLKLAKDFVRDIEAGHGIKCPFKEKNT